MRVINMKNSPKKPGVAVQSLAKGLAIMEYVAGSFRTVRLKDVISEFQIDQASAHRFLSTLEACGYIDKHPSTKEYTLATKLQGLSHLKSNSERLIEKIQPHLEDLVKLTGQTAHLAVLDRDQIKLVAVEDAKGMIYVRQDVGNYEPLYSSAVGKSIMAFLPEEQYERIKALMELTPLTENTLDSFEKLEAELALASQEHVAFDDCEGYESVCCIASPILDKFNIPLASIGISMVRPLVNAGPREQTQYIEAVREAAQRVEQTLLGKNI